MKIIKYLQCISIYYIYIENREGDKAFGDFNPKLMTKNYSHYKHMVSHDTHIGSLKWQTGLRIL